MVSPTLLEIAAGEFKGLLADYLLLKGSTFLGGRFETTESDWEAVHILFRQSLALDPYCFQTCYYIQAFLPWKGGMAREAIELLEISRKHRSWDWNPGYFIGFDYFYFLDDNLSASKYLMEASRLPRAPSLLYLLGSRLAQKGGQTETAIVFLKSMYDKSDDEQTREIIAQRIEALAGVFILEKGISQFTLRFGHPPKNLQELVHTEILEELPKNPYKMPYTYENGQIGF